MQAVLNEDQALLRESAVRLLGAVCGPTQARRVRQSGTGFDADAWGHMVAAGWLSTLVPEDAGGLGLGLFELAQVLDETGRQLALTPLLQASCVAWLLAHTGCSIECGGAIESGTSVVLPALVNEDASYDSRARLPVAVASGSGWRLDGVVRFVPFARAADAFVVAARTEAGELVLTGVPADAAGLHIAATTNVDGSGSGDLRFDHVEACSTIAVGDKAVELVAGLQSMLTLGSAAELVGLAQAALDMALGHLRLRQQFGKPLGSFQALQHRAVDRYVDIELNRSLVDRCFAAWDAGDCPPAMVSALKARASRVALETTRFALQMHGAIGYTDEHDIGLYYKRAIVLAALYGNENNHASRFSRLTLVAPGAEA